VAQALLPATNVGQAILPGLGTMGMRSYVTVVPMAD
jgi:hypothetical protein